MATCDICAEDFDVAERVPLVLSCGHTFCKACISREAELKGYIGCFNDRLLDSRAVDALPRKYSLISAANLDIGQLLTSANLGRIHRRLWVNDEELQVNTNSRLGSGATGQVFEGELYGRKVAVKVVQLSEASVSTRQALQREASVVMLVAGECQHTCHYQGATIKQNQFCLIMKRYDGSLMKKIAEAPGGLPVPTVLRYGLQVAAGLAELHNQGVLMLDLKPQNLLFDEALDELVLADFGLSRIVENTLGFTASLAMAGTPNYMSPEQFAFESEDGTVPRLTTAVDIWAWGCTMLHMLTGKSPYVGKSLQQITMQVGLQKRPPAIPDSIAFSVQQLLRSCLQVDPAQRPTAKEVMQAVQRLQEAFGAEGTEGQPVLKVMYVKRGESVTTLTLPWNPQQSLGQLKQHCASQLGVLVDKLPWRCTVDVDTPLGPEHDHRTLQQLGWGPGCPVLFGELDEEELQMFVNPNGKIQHHSYIRFWAEHDNLFKVQLLLAAGADPLQRNQPTSVPDVLLCPDKLRINMLTLLVQESAAKWDLQWVLRVMPKVLGEGSGTPAEVSLLERLAQLIESKASPGVQVQCGISSEMLLPCLPVIQRLTATGCIKWCLDPREWLVARNLPREAASTALQLDPDMLTYARHKREALWNDFCYLHLVCGAFWGPSNTCEDSTSVSSEDLKWALQFARPGIVNTQHKRAHRLENVNDECECYKCVSSLMTPLHVAVIVAGGYSYFGWGTYVHQEDAPFQVLVKRGGRRDGEATVVDHVQAAEGLLSLARELVEAGADVKMVNKWQETPVTLLADIVAAVEGQPFTVEEKQQLKAVFAKWQQLFGVGA